MRGLWPRGFLLVPAAVAVLALLCATVVPAAAGTLKKIPVATEGHNETNTVKAPVYDAAGVAPLAVGSLSASYDPKVKIVKGLGSLFTKGPTYDLAKDINLADLLAESMRAEAKAMGLPLAAPDFAGDKWEVTGDLKQIYTESWQITGWGSILFYGLMDVSLHVKGPGGVDETRPYRVHYFYQQPGAGGFGRGGAATSAVATLLVEGSQDLLAKLNRDFIKAPSTPDVEQRAAAVAKSGVLNHEADLRAVGLSGSPKVATVLMSMLSAEPKSDNRGLIIDAMGSTGAPEVLALLTERYAKEDELCRWYTLKALDYIGGEQALAFIKEKGPQDKEYSVKALASRVMEAK